MASAPHGVEQVRQDHYTLVVKRRSITIRAWRRRRGHAATMLCARAGIAAMLRASAG